MDRLVKGLAGTKGIRFLFVDVTATCGTLVERHEAGRMAGIVMGQGLAAAALLAADSDDPEECTSVQLMMDGPLGGLMVEATGERTLRGYVHRKLLGDLDQAGTLDPEQVLGTSGAMNVICSVPGKVVYSGQVDATPPEVRSALARYYNRSQQTPSAVELLADPEAGRVFGLVAQKMPDGDTLEFVGVLEKFNDGSVARFLEKMNSEDDPWIPFAGLDVDTVDTSKLSFACRCSPERATGALAALSIEELRETIDGPGTHEVTCHMCSQTYVLEQSVLLDVLFEKAKEGESS